MKLHFLNLKKWLALGLSLGLAVTSCQKNEDAPQELPSENQPTQTLPNKENQLILGKKLENPYSLVNMQKARETLLQQNDSGIKLSAFATPLNATHYYVVFLPENDAHIKTLSELVASKKFVTREHPMDYEVLQHGSEYRDTRTKDAKYPVLYASIPVNETMPNVPYEKLEDLYLPDEKNDPEEVLELSALYLVEKKQENNAPNMPKTAAMRTDISVPEMRAFLGFGRKWHPDGFVRVRNTNGQLEPLRNAEIQIYNWFFSTYCYTDNNGYFRSSERFSREMGVYTTWDSHSCKISSHWNEILGVRRSDKIGDIGRPTKDFEISRDNQHIWRKAVVHNAVQKFNDYTASQNIKYNSNYMHIWVDGGKHRGMAPMLHHYPWGVSQNSLLASWLKWLSPITIPISAVVTLYTQKSFPDIVLSFGDNESQERCEKLAFHEFAHAIHARQVGTGYWATFARRTTDNIVATGFDDPYRNGTEPSEWSGQNIALCEGWANFLEHSIISHYYPINAASYSLENFRMYSVPSNFDNRRARDNNRIYQGWFLHGLLWDLIDGVGETNIELRNGSNDTITRNNGMDNVQISIQQLFNALQSDISTATDLKTRLMQNIPAQAVAIEHLFNAYGF